MLSVPPTSEWTQSVGGAVENGGSTHDMSQAKSPQTPKRFFAQRGEGMDTELVLGRRESIPVF